MHNPEWKLALGMAIFAMIAGCGHSGQEASDRQTVQRPGKEITVIHNPESASYGDTNPNPLVRVNDVRGSDWLSDDQIVVSKENTSAKPVVVEGTQWLPLNLNMHTISTAEDAALAPGGDNQGYALLNPGRTHIFYKTYDIQSNTGTGFIMNLKTRKSVQITDKDELELTNGVWMDDQRVMYSSLDGTIFSVSADGSNKKVLLQTKQPMITNVSLVANVIYFTNAKSELYAYPLGGGKGSFVARNVMWAVPSPDGSQLALVQRNKPLPTLSLTDSKGGNPKDIAKGAQIFGVSWSPDGKRIAYADIAQNGTSKGIYVADASTRESSAVSVDVKILADAPRWSPSGDRLMVTAYVPDESGGKPRYVMYLAAVK